MYDQRLPIVNSDDGTWGNILRKYLEKEHYNNDTNDPENGGHKNVTIRAGTAGAGGAPLKFTSGTLLTTPEIGAMEFAGDNLYITQTSGITRKKIATYDITGGTGDLYYRDSGGYFTRLAIGSASQILTVSGGLPSWQNPASGTSTFSDSAFTLQDNGDATKQAKFELSGITAGQTRTVTVPDTDLTLIGTNTSQTLTNKRINPRVVTVTQSATPTLATDTGDVFIITGLAQNITSVSVTGTPIDGQLMRVSITGTAARTIAWGTSFEASTYRALPTTTVSTNRLDVNFIWNAATSKWRMADEGYGVGGTDVSVADGGTGRSTSATIYGIIAAGTTTTGPQQTIAPGTAGQFLKSAGASALGSFANITAADFTGTTAQFNAALTDNDFATLAGNEVLANKTMTAPKYANGGYIADDAGNEQIVFTTTTSAVNEIGITNAATGNAPQISARGGDANVSLNLVSKGTGRVQANGSNLLTANSTDTLTNKTFDATATGNSITNVPWASLAKPAVIAAGANIGEALSNVNLTEIVGGTNGASGRTNGAFARNALYSHPESQYFVPIPHAYNDIAYNNIRGGSVEIRVNGGVVAANGNNANAAFGPDATYEFADYYSSTSDTVVYEITLHRTFQYGYCYGIQQADWFRGQNITFEAYNGSSWSTLSSVTNQTTGLTWNQADAGGAGITKLRVTLTNFNSSTARITQIFIIPFNSELLSGTFLPRGGGRLYGDLQAPAVRINTIRDGDHGIGILDFYGLPSAVNYLQIQNSTTGNAPGIYAQGANANVDINLVPKGTGSVLVNGTGLVSANSTTTFANKTIDAGGSGNSITNIPTASIADGAVTSAKIADGTIMNADINASAAIAVSKLGTGRVDASVNGTATNTSIWRGTQAQYDAIGSKDSNTIYFITA